MKQQLIAGGELDLLTRGELSEVIETAIAQLLDRDPDPERQPLWADASAKSDASGTAQWDIEVSRPGQEFILRRVIVLDDNASVAFPYTNANLSIELMRGEKLFDFSPHVKASAGAQIPFVFEYDEGTAPRFRNGDTLTVKVRNGDASMTYQASAFGTLLIAPPPRRSRR